MESHHVAGLGAGIATVPVVLVLARTVGPNPALFAGAVGAVLAWVVWHRVPDEEPTESALDEPPGPENDDLTYCPRCGAMERDARSTCRFCGGEL